MVYQVPGTSEHRKTLIFWYKQISAPPQKKKEEKKALGARSEAYLLTTTLGQRNPPHPMA
jgi:hypothetical protein